MDENYEPNEFEQAVQADMMVNSMIRIARDLERVLIGIWACAGLLGLMTFLILLRLLIGR
jgi:hypothetical protein